MGTEAVAELSRRASALTYDDQLALLELLVSGLRKQRSSSQAEWDLSDMAADPQIRAELVALDREFRVTEFDGLG